MKLSIITINYNNLEGLKKTFNSVFSQTNRDFEYIVIDGGSNDGSKALIEENASKISYWISESDKGVFNAMNKGTAKIKGEYCIYMNSGDCFTSTDSIEMVVPFLNEPNDIIYGDLNFITPTGREVKKYDGNIDFWYFTYDTLPHQASFIKSEFLTKLMPEVYKEKYKLCSDWKFFMDAVCKSNARLKYLNFVVADYDYTGISSQDNNRPILKQEKMEVLTTEYKAFYFEYLRLYEKLDILRSRPIKLYLKIRALFKR